MPELNPVLIVSHDTATCTALTDTHWLPSAPLLPASGCPAPEQPSQSGPDLAEASLEVAQFVAELKKELRAS